MIRNAGDDCEIDCDEPEAASIKITDGGTGITICTGDGESDAFDETMEGGSGENSAWVITDDELNILALPPAPPFDLEGAGAGTCLVWYLGYNGDLSGAEVGANTGDLEGCFALSNPITVIRNAGDDCDPGCSAPNEFDVTRLNHNQVKISWNDVDGAKFYYVRIRRAGSHRWFYFLTRDAPTFLQI